MSSPNRCSPCHGGGLSWAAHLHTQLSLLLLGKRLQSTAIRRFSVFFLNLSLSRAQSIMASLHFPGLATQLQRSTC